MIEVETATLFYWMCRPIEPDAYDRFSPDSFTARASPG